MVTESNLGESVDWASSQLLAGKQKAISSVLLMVLKIGSALDQQLPMVRHMRAESQPGENQFADIIPLATWTRPEYDHLKCAHLRGSLDFSRLA